MFSIDRRSVALPSSRALGAFALALGACSVSFAPPARAAAPLTVSSPAAQAPSATSGDRNDYGDARFTEPLDSGLRHFYKREFKEAQTDFEKALDVIPDNTLAISFLNAAAAQSTGDLEVLSNVEEDSEAGAPKSYAIHVRLGFSADAREELNRAVEIAPDRAAAHVGLGILRFNERSANRAKVELLQALNADPNNVLAREYLGQLYQTDLRDPQKGLSFVIGVPNLVPAYADILFHIGSLFYDLKQYDDAVSYLKRGIALDTGNVGEAGQHGYTLIARVYIDEHKLTDAAKALTSAITADSDTIYAKTLLAKIKNGDYDTGDKPSPKP
jgi:tetratricopeptide (TPR) repeat protein